MADPMSSGRWTEPANGSAGGGTSCWFLRGLPIEASAATFFDGSVTTLMATLPATPKEDLPRDEVGRPAAVRLASTAPRDRRPPVPRHLG